MNLIQQFKHHVQKLKLDAYALYFAVRDGRTPWLAKILAGTIVAYALSPIDLIPDFIPILGYLDDLLLVPLGVWLAIRLIPQAVLTDCRAKVAELDSAENPRSLAGAVLIVLVWLALSLWLAHWIFQRIFGQ